MPQILSRALFLGGLTLCALGCSRFQRTKYDPFATAKQGNSKPDRAPADYPQLVPANGSDQVTEAGRDLYSRRPVADRSQRSQVASDRPRDNTQNSPFDSFDSDTARSPMRPAAGRPLDHAPDYSWIQGKLEYTNLGGGIWRVRYAPLSADDEHGGCVILQSVPNERQFRAGDTVYAEGRIVEPSTRGPLPNPVYRVDLMSRVGE